MSKIVRVVIFFSPIKPTGLVYWLYNKIMKVIAVLIVISTIATVCAFAPSRSVQHNNAVRTQSSALDLFNFKAKEASSSVATANGGGDINAAKRKFDGILKKNSKLILMISGSAKDGIKGECC